MSLKKKKGLAGSSLGDLINAGFDGETILDVKNLHVCYHTVDDDVLAVNGVDLTLKKGESLGIVGETGAGKTTLALSVMGLLPRRVGEVTDGSITFMGVPLVEADEKLMRQVRGDRISMIFQDPMTSLNPTMTVGDQILEVLKLHNKFDDPESRVDEILKLVGIEPSRKICYPHQFSGGMKQRIVIAMALACEPDLLIADEPTTALDVTIQSQVLAMIGDIQEKLGTSLILITHDLGVVAETCDKVCVMYAGEIVEYGTLEQVFDKNLEHHPYTTGLFNCIPDLASDKARLDPIPGLTADPAHLPDGCYFSPRCSRCTDECRSKHPAKHRLPNGQMISCNLCSGGTEAQS